MRGSHLPGQRGDPLSPRGARKVGQPVPAGSRHSKVLGASGHISYEPFVEPDSEPSTQGPPERRVRAEAPGRQPSHAAASRYGTARHPPNACRGSLSGLDRRHYQGCGADGGAVYEAALAEEWRLWRRVVDANHARPPSVPHLSLPPPRRLAVPGAAGGRPEELIVGRHASRTGFLSAKSFEKIGGWEEVRRWGACWEV